MTELEFIEVLAQAFDIEPNEDGEYDLDDYDWQAGCSFGYGSGKWLSLANIVKAFRYSGYLEEE